MKKYIDYLFWKRTWFRMLFVLFPSWLLICVLVAYYILPDHGSMLLPYEWTIKNIICAVYITTVVCAMIDNEDIDNPPNPFRKDKNDSFKIH